MANSVERYYQKKKKRKKKAKMVFFGSLLALTLLTVVILSVTVFFNADKIVVKGNVHYTAEKILQQGGIEKGQNLFRLNKFKSIEKMQQLPYVKEVTINRKLPNTLEITIIENQPVVWVSTTNGVALLNEEYRVLELLEIPADQLPDPAEVVLFEQEKEELKKQEAIKEQLNQKEDQEDLPEEEQEELEEEIEEEVEDEQEAEEEPKEEKKVHPRLVSVPQLVGVQPKGLAVGEIADLGSAVDYAGFLKQLYNAFGANELSWKKVNEVQFRARYDIRAVYDGRVIIDFGTLSQVQEKLDLSAVLLKEQGTGRLATVHVSNPKSPVFSPMQ